MSTVTDMLAAIDAKIATIVASPSDIADYKIGDKTVNRSQILEFLLKARDTYQVLAEKEPYEDIRHIASDFDELGTDISELVGDDYE